MTRGLVSIAHQGTLINVSFMSEMFEGAIGDIYGTPKECSEQTCVSKPAIPSIIPYWPVAPARIVKNILMIAMASEKGVITKDVIAVMATTITIGAPINPAETAASPITRAPTILTACPTTFGKRTPASLSISNMININKASINTGKGVPSCAAAILTNSAGGNNS